MISSEKEEERMSEERIAKLVLNGYKYTGHDTWKASNNRFSISHLEDRFEKPTVTCVNKKEEYKSI